LALIDTAGRSTTIRVCDFLRAELPTARKVQHGYQAGRNDSELEPA